MQILVLLLPISLLLVGGALLAFSWAADNGQFDELDRHGMDLFTDSEDSP